MAFFKSIFPYTQEVKAEYELMTNEALNNCLLLAEKAYRLIQSERMKSVDKRELLENLSTQINSVDFNLYQFISRAKSSILMNSVIQ